MLSAQTTLQTIRIAGGDNQQVGRKHDTIDTAVADDLFEQTHGVARVDLVQKRYNLFARVLQTLVNARLHPLENVSVFHATMNVERAQRFANHGAELCDQAALAATSLCSKNQMLSQIFKRNHNFKNVQEAQILTTYHP